MADNQQISFQGYTLAKLVMLMVDGENSEDKELVRFYEDTLKESLIDATEKKVDAFAAVMARLGNSAAAAKAELEAEKSGEVKRLEARYERITRELDRLKDRALEAIVISGGKKLEGNTATLKASGVPASCEVYDEAKIPDEFRNVEISLGTMTVADWLEFSGNKYKIIDSDPKLDFVYVENSKFQLAYSIDKRALLKALKQPCQRCQAKGRIDNEGVPFLTEAEYEAMDESGTWLCPMCSGAKTRQIPGARLIENRFRLVVE